MFEKGFARRQMARVEFSEKEKLSPNLLKMRIVKNNNKTYFTGNNGI